MKMSYPFLHVVCLALGIKKRWILKFYKFLRTCTLVFLLRRFHVNHRLELWSVYSWLKKEFIYFLLNLFKGIVDRRKLFLNLLRTTLRKLLKMLPIISQCIINRTQSINHLINSHVFLLIRLSIRCYLILCPLNAVLKTFMNSLLSNIELSLHFAVVAINFWFPRTY